MGLRTTVTVLLLIAALGHDRFAVRERAQVVLTRLHVWADLSDYLRAGPFPNEETRQRMLLVAKVRPAAARLSWQKRTDCEAVEATAPSGRYYVAVECAEGWGVIASSGRESRDAVLAGSHLPSLDAAQEFAEKYERRFAQ